MSNSCQIALDVMEDVRPLALMVEECRELYAILTTPHIRVRIAIYGLPLPKMSSMEIDFFRT